MIFQTLKKLQEISILLVIQKPENDRQSRSQIPIKIQVAKPQSKSQTTK